MKTFICLLIALYIMQANGIVIPQGCFIAAWIVTVIGVICAIAAAYAKNKETKEL